MTLGQYKELIEFLDHDNEDSIIRVKALRAKDDDTIEITLYKQVDDDVLHYILITIPITKEI